MTQLGYADAESGARAWARTLDLGPASTKVFFGKPRGDSLPRAWVEVRRVGGAPEAEIVPVDDVDLQWDVYGANKSVAWSIVSALELAVKLLHTGSWFGDHAAVIGTEITLGPVWRPEEDPGLGRYVLGTLIKLRPVAAVPA